MIKKIRKGFLALLLLYIVWLGFKIISFKKYSFEQGKNTQNEISGIYHIHSTFSDGKKTADEIVEIAQNNNNDFIILTDHGNPNYESIAFQGWKKELLVLAGSELSVNRGHLSAVGFNLPEEPFAHNAEESASQIARLNGLSIIAHPYSKTSWTWGNLFLYSGIEILEASSSFKTKPLRQLHFLPTLWLKPDLFMLQMLYKPTKNLRKWDSINKKHAVFGYFSADAHFFYNPLFKLLRIHIPLSSPLSKDFTQAKKTVIDALRKGQFYNVIETAALCSGFEFYGIQKKKKIQMGQTISFNSMLSLHVKTPFPYKKEIHIIHNGKSVALSQEKKLDFKVKLPGVYRVEVYLKERTPLKKNIPWIISNPIFVR